MCCGSFVMCKCLPMEFFLLNVVLTGDVIIIKTHAPAPTHTSLLKRNNGRVYSVVFLEALLLQAQWRAVLPTFHSYAPKPKQP